MPPTIEEIRDRAALHERELSEKQYLSVKDVAAIISLSETFVRDIPRDELPFIEFGHGHKLKRRRYARESVDRYLTQLHTSQNTTFVVHR